MTKLKTKGISKKIVADLLASVVTFAVLALGVELDEVTSAFIAKAIGFVAGVIAPPNDVEQVPA